jgi:hypothetical protein
LTHIAWEISNNLYAEPVFRDADIVLDLNSVKVSDSGNFTYFTPNGFGKEICSLARYAGISDKVC